jgi:regulator of protease activity HflC (stomatin/prohibitin superfamily)
MVLALVIIVVVLVLLVAVTTYKTVRIVPQARARNVERLGRYRKTLEPGMNFIIPFIDRVKPTIDLREQVVSFQGQRVITEDNLVVSIDTVLFFQITDPRAADYEIVNYIQAVEQLTATMLRSVIGSMDLEQALTSRDKINTMLRGVLDDASGKWGIRVTRVEIKAIDPPQSVKDAMEKQMRAEREKRAAILNAEGVRQSQILTADGDKQGAILRAEGDKQGQILRAEGQAQAIAAVNQAIHDSDPDPKLLAYQYLQTLPQLAGKPGNTVWVVPSELTGAMKMLSSAFGASSGDGGGAQGNGSEPRPRTRRSGGTGHIGSAGIGGQAAPAELAGQVGQALPAELPATKPPSRAAASEAADAVTQAAAEAADAARTAGVATPGQGAGPGSGVVNRQAEGQQDAEG